MEDGKKDLGALRTGYAARREPEAAAEHTKGPRLSNFDVSQIEQEAQDRRREDEWDELRAINAALLDALEPFAVAFNKAREKYTKRYGSNHIIGRNNFDAMPDAWPMEGLEFSMGTFRAVRAAIARAQGDQP